MSEKPEGAGVTESAESRNGSMTGIPSTRVAEKNHPLILQVATPIGTKVAPAVEG